MNIEKSKILVVGGAGFVGSNLVKKILQDTQETEIFIIDNLSRGQFDPEFRRLPRAGELFLWPAFLHHLVHPNLVDVPRLSISFNIVIQ